MTDHWYDDVVMPMLLDAARRGYGRAMRDALASAGHGDVPPLGMRVVGGIARNGPLGPDVAAQLGVRGDRGARVIDTLIDRGYIVAVRADDADATTYELTPLGTTVAATSAEAAAAFEDRVRTEVGDEALDRARAVLAVMVELSDPHFEE